MRAAVVREYGGPEVVHLEEVPDPAPRRGEVLVRVRAAAVTSADARIRGARFPRGFAAPARLVFGVRRPRHPVLGAAVSGVVEAVGDGVSTHRPGDQVCGLAGMRLGAHAELVAVRASRLAAKPPEVGHDEAAGVLFGGTTALHYLRDKAGLARGRRVLVNGASGAIGTNAVQLAAAEGAAVTAVTSARNADLVRRLGADTVVDYATTPVTVLADRFDIVLDTVGNLTLASGRRLLAERGVLLLAVASLGQTLRARGNVKAGPAPERLEDVQTLLQLVAKGELTVVLDDALPLEDIVAAHRRVDSGRKVGNLVVRP